MINRLILCLMPIHLFTHLKSYLYTSAYRNIILGHLFRIKSTFLKIQKYKQNDEYNCNAK